MSCRTYKHSLKTQWFLFPLLWNVQIFTRLHTLTATSPKYSQNRSRPHLASNEVRPNVYKTSRHSLFYWPIWLAQVHYTPFIAFHNNLLFNGLNTTSTNTTKLNCKWKSCFWNTRGNSHIVIIQKHTSSRSMVCSSFFFIPKITIIILISFQCCLK